ncbi:hypothetical protein ACR9VJ_09030 [Streptomyces sp. H49]
MSSSPPRRPEWTKWLDARRALRPHRLQHLVNTLEASAHALEQDLAGQD